jgi:ATP-dependent Clp endopeptidase proteolytic subunit ClpP
MNFNYTVNVDSDEPIMLINRHIGYDETDGYGIMGDLFQAELLALDDMGKKRIQVWINSVGGIVMDGYNIYNAILKTKTKVDTYCMGIAASMAAVIFQAGRKRIMADYSQLMYHNPFGGDDKKSLDAMGNSLVKMISTRSGKPEDEVSKMMDKTTWIGASDAFAQGLCDEIEVSSEQNKKRLVPSNAKAMWKEASTVLNSLIPIQNTTMKKVANKLGLNPEASEDAIVEGINSLQTRATAAETKLTEVQNKAKDDEKAHAEAMAAKETEIKNLKDSIKKNEDELNKMKSDKEAADKKAKEADEAAKEEKAKNMVTGYARMGKIKNDEATIKSWTAKAKDDFAGVETMLKDIPVNKINNKIDTSRDSDGKPVGYSAAGVMAQIANKTRENK